MVDLLNTISTLPMIANGDSGNWQRQADTAIHTYLANHRGISDARNRLLKEFTKVNPATERGNAIQDMIAA